MQLNILVVALLAVLGRISAVTFSDTVSVYGPNGDRTIQVPEMQAQVTEMPAQVPEISVTAPPMPTTSLPTIQSEEEETVAEEQRAEEVQEDFEIMTDRGARPGSGEVKYDVMDDVEKEDDQDRYREEVVVVGPRKPLIEYRPSSGFARRVEGRLQYGDLSEALSVMEDRLIRTVKSAIFNDFRWHAFLKPISMYKFGHVADILGATLDLGGLSKYAELDFAQIVALEPHRSDYPVNVPADLDSELAYLAKDFPKERVDYVFAVRLMSPSYGRQKFVMDRDEFGALVADFLRCRRHGVTTYFDRSTGKYRTAHEAPYFLPVHYSRRTNMWIPKQIPGTEMVELGYYWNPVMAAYAYNVYLFMLRARGYHPNRHWRPVDFTSLMRDARTRRYFAGLKPLINPKLVFQKMLHNAQKIPIAR